MIHLNKQEIGIKKDPEIMQKQRVKIIFFKSMPFDAYANNRKLKIKTIKSIDLSNKNCYAFTIYYF